MLHPASSTSSDAEAPREFTATVTEIRELCRIGGKPLFQVALDRSPFMVADAEQGTSLGTLTATSRMGAVLVAPVTAVQKDAHGEVWHTTVKPLQPGTLVVCNPG